MKHLPSLFIKTSHRFIFQEQSIESFTQESLKTTEEIQKMNDTEKHTLVLESLDSQNPSKKQVLFQNIQEFSDISQRRILESATTIDDLNIIAENLKALPDKMQLKCLMKQIDIPTKMLDQIDTHNAERYRKFGYNKVQYTNIYQRAKRIDDTYGGFTESMIQNVLADIPDTDPTNPGGTLVFLSKVQTSDMENFRRFVQKIQRNSDGENIASTTYVLNAEGKLTENKSKLVVQYNEESGQDEKTWIQVYADKAVTNPKDIFTPYIQQGLDISMNKIHKEVTLAKREQTKQMNDKFNKPEDLPTSPDKKQPTLEEEINNAYEK